MARLAEMAEWYRDEMLERWMDSQNHTTSSAR